MRLSGLIAGLGNPGREYETTRHNAGFMVIDQLLEHAGPLASQLSAGPASRNSCLLWRCFLVPGAPAWILLKPQTFMNASGDAVRLVMSWFSIEPGSLLAIHDEMDLPLGALRFKTGGGDAGHKGLKSITRCLGTPDYHRLRLGIGRPEHPDAVDWVLGRFAPAERDAFGQTIDAARDCALAYAGHGPEAARSSAGAFALAQKKGTDII